MDKNKEISKGSEKVKNIDLFWKAREYRNYEKNVDWYWYLWIGSLVFMLFVFYFFHDKFLVMFVFLVTVIASFGHRMPEKFKEYRINNNAIILDNGRRQIFFDDIESFNIDMEHRYILINTKKKYEKLVRVPFEPNHNISVIENILKIKLKEDVGLRIPKLELIFERILGFH